MTTETPTKTESKTFEVGRTYKARSAADWDCVWSFEVVARSAKFITITEEDDPKPRRVGVYTFQGVEHAKPLGTFSLCPILAADKEVC